MADATITTPISIPLPMAMERLNLTRPTISDMIARGVFTVLAPRGRGVGKPLWVLTAEIEVYDRTRSEAAVKAYRERVAAELNPADVGEAGA